ncbi:MAG: DegT/DnrJ/EryC1/StrS family aminotransferase [Candidatus Marinimicrobia bacterium]|nr:DegT/DnrJ/EryC1/StrS family aminotransferase [Candidatus Neomarinimicrobiota bacterium]
MKKKRLIQYYSPNLNFKKVLKALFVKDAKKKTREFYRHLTNKKYILLTSSCRSALYLTYKSMGKGLPVLVSPLTCSSALDPIYYSNNKIYFSDISWDTLNIDIKNRARIPTNVKVIQVIHLGGVPADMETIKKFARKRNITIVEDCAQSFCAKYKGHYTGSFGDVSCFSLIKNAYGIGGGVLATNDYEIYRKAREYQENLEKIPTKVIIYRILRNIIETKRILSVYNYIFTNLMNLKNKFHDEYIDPKRQFFDYVKQPNEILFKIFIQQSFALNINHFNRVNNGLKILKRLASLGVGNNYKYINFKQITPSFTKLFIYINNFDSSVGIKKLNSMGIMAKHLEQKYNSFYQVENNLLERYSSAKFIGSYDKYRKIHHSLVSLPLNENFNNGEVEEIISKLQLVVGKSSPGIG